jgi:hypothetical protein
MTGGGQAAYSLMSSASDLRSDRTGTDAPLCGAQSRAESGKILESLNEIRGILRDIDERGWENALPKGGPGAFLQRAKGTCAPRPAIPARAALEASFTPVVAVPHMPLGGAAVMLDLVLTAVPDAVPFPRRNSTALAVLMIAGLVVFGATSLVVAQGPNLPHPAASVSGTRQSRLGDRPEAAARAALPSALIPAVAKSDTAAVAPLSAAARKPKPLPVAYEGPARTPGARAAFTAPPQPDHAAPPNAGAAPTMPPRAAPARTVPSALAHRTEGRSPGDRSPGDRSPEDRSLGKSLRQAGDVKILEGDVASARLFYERAADAGDARAALDLGNSFNPAFLDRLGVLGMRGNVVAAARWYRQARILGSPDAEKALHTLPR